MRRDVLVIGLGRFGSAVARELARLGHDVMAVDHDERTVNDIAPHVTRAVQLDAADEDALRAAGAGDFPTAVVAVSSDVEASIFATLALKRLGVGVVIAKAGSELHGAILERVGATRVVFPEAETGRDLAHTLAVPHVVDYIDVGQRYGIAKLRTPASLAGRSLSELSSVAADLTPLALRRGDELILRPSGSERLREGDDLVVVGPDEQLERLGR